MSTSALMARFVPYYKKYWKTMVFDLFCASLTTICDLVLPLLLRYITNQGMWDLALLTTAGIARMPLNTCRSFPTVILTTRRLDRLC